MILIGLGSNLHQQTATRPFRTSKRSSLSVSIRFCARPAFMETAPVPADGTRGTSMPLPRYQLSSLPESSGRPSGNGDTAQAD